VLASTAVVNASSTATWVVRQVVDDIGLLSVEAGPDRGRSFELDKAVVRIGSGDQADVRLTDRAVSRLHCELTIDGATLRLRDLGSKNGTWVGKCRIYEADVAAGTQVRVGETTLVLGVEKRPTRKAVWQGGDHYGSLFGASPAMHRLYLMLERLAASREPVLVRGESGTGKELVARALHERGPRPDGPFVIVDGGALSRTLAEAELFGHARGAFTGAATARAGALERAHGGTLFIDEIGELPLELQPTLLRFLEEGTVQRLGESARKHVEVRVVAATHRPLERMMNEGTFREDLYHRLAVVELRVPPLRDRLADVPLIARAILAELAPNDAELAATVERALAERARHRWSGNVRELRNLVRRIVALGEADGLPIVASPDAPGDTPEPPRVDLPMAEAKQRWIEIFERRYLERLLAETGGNVSEAARRSDVDRGHLGKLVARYGLKR